MNKIKILVFSDSLGLPRNVPQTVNWDETWVQLLSSNYDVQYCSIGGATVSDLFRQTAYYKMFNPDLVIVQSGIVDCAPRALTEFEKTILEKNSLLNTIFKKYFTKERQIKYRNRRKITLTSISDFKNIILEFKKCFEKKIVWVEILPVSNAYEKMVPGITRNATFYNNLIEEVFEENTVKLDNLKPDCLMSDHHHPNKEGHLHIFNEVNNKIKKHFK